MRYVGHIYRLYLMMAEKGFTLEEIIDKIYENMNNDEAIIGGITRTEIQQVIKSKTGL